VSTAWRPANNIYGIERERERQESAANLMHALTRTMESDKHFVVSTSLHLSQKRRHHLVSPSLPLSLIKRHSPWSITSVGSGFRCRRCDAAQSSKCSSLRHVVGTSAVRCARYLVPRLLMALFLRSWRATLSSGGGRLFATVWTRHASGTQLGETRRGEWCV